MSEPTFLTLDQVLGVHARSLEEHGGTQGIRDLGLIESALASAQNTFYYANGDVFEVAAALVFLALNGVYAQPPQWALYLAMIDVAEKKKSKADLAVIFRTSAGSV